MSPTLISGATAVCTATVSLLHSIEWIDNDWRAHSPSTAFRSLSTRPCLCYPHFGGSFQPPTRREQPAGSSGGPDAAPVARGAGRAGRCPRPWPAAAARNRARHPVVPDPLGPPGSGKTSLARLIAAHTKAQFEPFSAVTSGIPELRQVVKTAEQRRIVKGQRTILFVDEIHRFNKAQQDAFLPHVESGTVILIGATTENPSFEVISPLLSRSLVVVLQPLSEDALLGIIERALRDPERGLGRYHMKMDVEAMMSLAAFANGDGRVALNALEFAVLHTAPGADGLVHLNKEALATALQKKSLRYDKGGEEHYNVISAFIKSLRDSDPDGALYWLPPTLEAC